MFRTNFRSVNQTSSITEFDITRRWILRSDTCTERRGNSDLRYRTKKTARMGARGIRVRDKMSLLSLLFLTPVFCRELGSSTCDALCWKTFFRQTKIQSGASESTIIANEFSDVVRRVYTEEAFRTIAVRAFQKKPPPFQPSRMRITLCKNVSYIEVSIFE